jgi:hypothetical protein
VLNEERVPVSWQELRAAQEFLGLTDAQVWIAYFAMTGTGTEEELRRWLSGDTPMPSIEHDYLAAALNDMFSERGMGRPVRYHRSD